MSSRISKKKKSSTTEETRKADPHGRNRQTSAVPAVQGGMLERFTRWRVISYVSVICLPPYGLYRIWSKESTFELPEKVVWTFITFVYVMQLSKFILFS